MDNEKMELATLAKENTLSLQDEMQKGQNDIYCSLDLMQEENRITMINIMNKADGLLKEHIDETIALKDVYVSRFERVDDTTGEVNDHFYTVLILGNGTTLCTTSYGIYSSLKRIFALLGTPDKWKEPLNVIPREKSMTNKKGTTLQLEVCTNK